jgi:hypothetical protein
MTQIWERLFISSLDGANKLAETNPHRITTVISLCDAAPRKAAKGVNYLHFPISDIRPVAVGTFDRIMDEVAVNIRWGRVLIHCAAGSVRAPLIAASYHGHLRLQEHRRGTRRCFRFASHYVGFRHPPELDQETSPLTGDYPARSI